MWSPHILYIYTPGNVGELTLYFKILQEGVQDWERLEFLSWGGLMYAGKVQNPRRIRWGFPTQSVCVFVFVQSLESCPVLCNPMYCSSPGSSVHGISQARILEWVAISYFRGSSGPRDWRPVSCIAGRFFTTWAIRECTEAPKTKYIHIFTYSKSQRRNKNQNWSEVGRLLSQRIWGLGWTWKAGYDLG